MQTIDLDIAPGESPAASAIPALGPAPTPTAPAGLSRRVRSGSLDETTAGGRRDETGRAVPQRPPAA